MTLRFRLIFATACAVLAIMLGAAYSDKVKADVERQRSDAIARYGGEVVGVVVTKDGLRPGDVVEASDVGMRDWVAELVPEGALTGLNDVVGREVTCPVARNSIMTQTCFESESEFAEVPAGFVGISIPFSDKLGVSCNVARGARLIAYAVDKDGSKRIGTGIEVLSSSGATASATSAAQIVVAVRASDVERVLSASNVGTLKFVVPADDVDAKDVGAGPNASAHPQAPQVVVSEGGTVAPKAGTP